MEYKTYFLKLGQLLSNLHSLEFVLRIFLDKKNPVASGPDAIHDIYSLSVEQTLPINFVTNHDAFS